MCLFTAKRFFTLLFLFSAGAAAAQNSNKENAPYSRYGIGELLSGTNTLLRGMGSAATAYSSPTAVNTDNPASYAFLKRTTYEAGAVASTRGITIGQQHFNTGSASLGYLNVGIPLGKLPAGIAFGLRPQSRVYYNSMDTSHIDGLGRTISRYSGEGGLNYAYLGIAGRVKGFSLGVNAGYLFGTIRNTALLEPVDTIVSQNTDVSRFTKIGSIYWKAGAQYEAALKKSLKLRLGATLALNQDLNASRDEYYISYHYSPGTADRIDDTSYRFPGASGKVTLPMTYSFGAQVGSDKWTLAADYAHTKWSDYRSFGLSDSMSDGAYRISVGGEYTPNATSLYHYLQRVTYRLGFYYGNDYVKLRNTDITYYAVTAGASLPFRRSTDRIHLALEVGRKGTETNNLVRENFVRLHLGISLNDLWFIPRKYD